MLIVTSANNIQGRIRLDRRYRCAQVLHLRSQYREILLHCGPNGVGVCVEVAVRHTVPHRIRQLPGYLGMRSSTCRIGTLEVPGGFAYDLDVADDSILHHLVREETCLILALHVTLNALYSLQYVI